MSERWGERQERENHDGIDVLVAAGVGFAAGVLFVALVVLAMVILGRVTS